MKENFKIYKGRILMKSNNLKINISFKNDDRYFVLDTHLQAKRDKYNYIKDLLEIKLLKEMLKKRNQKKHRTLE